MKTVPVENLVLDASAVLAYLLAERGAHHVKTDLRACQAGARRGWLSALTLAELARRLRRSLAREDAHRSLDHLLLTPLGVVPVDGEIARTAGDWAYDTGVGLADCVVAATGARLAARVLTADPDFRRLADRARIDLLR